MSMRFDRRTFVKAGTAGLSVFALGRFAPAAEAVAKGAPNAEKIGWRLGCQAYSFNKFTFFEALEKNASLGLKVIEAYPGQKLSAAKPDVKFGPGMPADALAEALKKAADLGIKIVNFGVVGLSKDEAASRKVFDFAKQVGIETIVSEPPADAFDTIEKLCEEYKINVALHNHPEPSPYWKPEVVLERTNGRSKRIGACADTGHWMRSGINPLDALKKLEGRIISFHFKDLNEFGNKKAHDLPWGTGKADAKALLAEIYRQKIKAVFSIEYEHNWLESLPEIAQCVVFFDKTAKELAG